MAGKKPAKPMAGQSKQVTLDPTIYGQLTKFVGSKTAPAICAKCNRATIRGMMRVLNDKFYCSITCVKPAEKVEELDN